MKKQKEKSKKMSHGFTLIEMIVAVAIFMIVAVVAVGSLVRVVALNRQAQTLQASVNNISFSLDSMSREIRQGTKIGCFQPGQYTGQSITPNTVTGACANMTPNTNNLIVFQTGKVDPTNKTCNLYYVYWFKQLSAASYTLEKAQQTACNQSLSDNGGNGDFYPIIDPGVTLTGFNLALFSDPSSGFTYKWVFVRMAGFAGVRSQDQNSFDVETSISQRVRD